MSRATESLVLGRPKGGSTMKAPFSFFWLVVCFCSTIYAWAADAPKPYGPVPSPRQLRWHDLEVYGFLHFGPNTFTDKEWGYGDESEKIFNPTDFDADQIVRTAKEAGMRGLILTCKHHDGFCLWPSKYTEHSVKNSPWKRRQGRRGQGDFRRLPQARPEVRRLSLALGPQPQGLRPPGVRHLLPQPAPRVADQLRADLRGVVRRGQRRRRLLRRRADHAADRQPHLLRLGQHLEDRPRAAARCLHVQRRRAGLPLGGQRGGLRRRDLLGHDQPRRTCCRAWPMPSVLNGGQRHGTRLAAGRGRRLDPAGLVLSCQAKTARSNRSPQLLKIYYESVGRGCNLILNLPPDRRGQIHENDAKALREWRRILDATFATDLARGAKATASNTRGDDPQFAPGNVVDGNRDTYWATDDAVTTAELVLDLGKPVTFNVVRVREYLPLGQRVDSFALDSWEDGKWTEFATATSIGNQRLLRTPSITTSKVRLRITKAAACPAISEVGLFLAPEK